MRRKEIVEETQGLACVLRDHFLLRQGWGNMQNGGGESIKKDRDGTVGRDNDYRTRTLANSGVRGQAHFAVHLINIREKQRKKEDG